MKKTILSLIKFFLGWPLSLVAIFFLGRIIFSQTTHFSWSMFHPNSLLLVLSLFAFILYFFVRAFFWQQLLREQGHEIDLQDTIFLWGVSELQRYIPGNIWSILGRTVSFEKRGVSKKTTALSWLYESEFLLVTAIFVSLLAIEFLIYGLLPAFALKTLLIQGLKLLTWAGVIVFIGHFAFTKNLPKLLQKIFPPFAWLSNIKLLLLMVASFFFFGIGTYFSIASFIPLYPHDFDTFLGFFAFSYAVGYLSFIFPMGLGAREAMMTYGLSKYIPLSAAGIGALFSRIVLVAAEVVFVVIAFLWYRVPKSKLKTILQFCTKHKYAIAVGVAILLYAAYFTTASFLRYDNFFTGRFDLGNMDQTVWNTVHGRLFQLTDPDGTNVISRLAIHADFILVLLAPFYLLWQDPRMLLLIQTLVLSAGAIFVYLLAKDILKNKLFGFLFAALYLANPSMEYTNLYDFHGVTLATTFLLGAYYFLKKKQTLFFLLFLLLAGTTKEEAWVVVALFGIYAFFIEKRKMLGTMLFIAGSGFFYYIFFKAIPLVRGGQHFAVAFYSDFGNSPASILRNVLIHPLKTVTTLFTLSKMNYLLELLLPVAFLSLAAPLVLIFTLPDLGVNLLSSNTGFHEIYFQYTAVITPFLFIAAIYGLKRLQAKFPKISTTMWIGILCFVGVYSVYIYGPLPFSRRANVDMFWLEQPNKALINTFLSSIPRHYSIAATNNIGSHLSHRQLIYTIPTGIDKADILVFLLNDQYAQPSPKAQIQMTEKLRQDPRYVEAIHIGDFDVFEKKSIYPHVKATQRPNSLFPTLIQGIRQTFTGKVNASTSKSS